MWGALGLLADYVHCQFLGRCGGFWNVWWVGGWSEPLSDQSTYGQKLGLGGGAPDWQGHGSYGGRALPAIDSFVY